MIRGLGLLLLICGVGIAGAQEFSSYVNPFIGTSNYGATNPGAIAPRGMVSVSPFNVAGKQNVLEKDAGWLSNPYVYENTFLTGFSHVNLSGVGCPDLGVILLMPTTGDLETNHLAYGSTYSDEEAATGYYRVKLDRYDVETEMTATTRTGISRYSFPAGKSNILLNLGLGLTNESGASVKVVSPTEIEGMRTVGSFCYYKPEESYPVYFVAEFSHPADEFGVWKTPHRYSGPEAQWMPYNGKTRIMKGYRKEVLGDSVGVYFSYGFEQPTQVEVKVGVSYVSIANARENLRKETSGRTFEELSKSNNDQWNELLSRVKVEGGSEDDKTIFYTALYHTLIHPSTLNDCNGEYPAMATRETLKTEGTRFTVFSLWDTYRNLHPLMSLLYPDQQSDMVKSMLNIYDESGWLPKWELNATETTTMVGDPAGIVLTDTYLRGIQDFDVMKAYEAMKKSAEALEDNPLRPGNSEYWSNGYLTIANAGPVSTTQEYNITDHAIAMLAKELGDQPKYEKFAKQSISYRNLYDAQLQLLRPKNPDGSWYAPYDPAAGANFAKNVGFIEGNAWQYTFMVTHDVHGLIDLMGGEKPFADQLQRVFDEGQFDMANEPDIAYPFLFNYVKGEEWKSQQRVRQLVREYFKNSPDGLPGNDDTGTMSAWVIYSMMGIYPISPGDPVYTLTAPMFDRVTITLDGDYYSGKELVIERTGNPEGYIREVTLDGASHEGYFIDHEKLVNGGVLQMELE
ncbi:GH92 family glycosyl hydrolase [Marinoscillum furvescens]|uniref:Putative alpha-1,2-mannosidase n=1 Tax=Marinoscillum furvescens DSM 4134 TaxID=1122208 RepID=A0A3D9LHZ7_MARFU|nr:GH92 family glycosyl hydrolase [Marinoscillum furvescens]REE05495.1 putative alpha-1,2-mannosidase [Marinoscillum furvescens DSM 4134]